MQIAFLHFHLKTGGVTSVIARQVEAVRTFGAEPVILSGEPPQRPMGCEVIQVPQLAYDQPGRQPDPPEITARTILEALKRRGCADPPIVHAHNPTLAKNRGMQAVLKCLQEHGIRLLCQIHDFAEDGRPAFFFDEPYVADCHYAVLNRRDYALLRASGLKESGLHLLPNPILPLPKPDRTQTDAEEDGGVLYPVRAIRRKNIGEALLLSRYFNPPAPLTVTLPPNSQPDRLSYARWRSFASDLHLDTHFDAGLMTGLDVLVSRCRYVLTTSISEGFGFAFLEPWTADKCLWGRVLPDICADFIDNGLRLDGMYERFSVPLDFFDHPALRRQWQSAWLSAAHRFGIEVAEAAARTGWEAVSPDGMIDFGLLNESAQKQVIECVTASREKYRRLIRLNRFLERPGPPEALKLELHGNRSIVERHYAPARYGHRLHAVYKSIINDPMIRHAVDKRVLIEALLRPRTFSLLKWEPFDA